MTLNVASKKLRSDYCKINTVISSVQNAKNAPKKLSVKTPTQKVREFHRAKFYNLDVNETNDDGFFDEHAKNLKI